MSWSPEPLDLSPLTACEFHLLSYYKLIMVIAHGYVRVGVGGWVDVCDACACMLISMCGGSVSY